MNDSDDELRRLLSRHDPAAGDHPPARDSDRYRSILENAMRTEDNTTIPHLGRGDPRPERSRRHRWHYVITAVAAVAVLGVVGVVVLGTNAPDAQATVKEAATAIGAVTSLEGELEVSSPERNGTSRIRVAGADFQLTSEGTYADGHTEASTQTVVDGYLFETIDGTTTRSAFDAQQGPAPFGASSEAVIAAATSGSDVVEVGTEQVDDASATRFDIRLTPDSVSALSALTPNQLGWFELEYPDQIEVMSVWVADGLVRQIEIDHGNQTTRTRFSDLNGDVQIQAPPGPYVEQGG